MGKLYRNSAQTKLLAHGVAQNADLYIPFSKINPEDNPSGRVLLSVKTDVVGTGPSTSLAMTAAPIITPKDETVVIPTISALSAYTAITTLETALDWDDGATYVYDLTFVLGVNQPYGYRIAATYSGGAGKTMNATFRLIVE